MCGVALSSHHSSSISRLGRFRVLKGFVAQFGMNPSWRGKKFERVKPPVDGFKGKAG